MKAMKRALCVLCEGSISSKSDIYIYIYAETTERGTHGGDGSYAALAGSTPRNASCGGAHGADAACDLLTLFDLFLFQSQDPFHRCNFPKGEREKSLVLFSEKAPLESATRRAARA